MHMCKDLRMHICKAGIAPCSDLMHKLNIRIQTKGDRIKLVAMQSHNCPVVQSVRMEI